MPTFMSDAGSVGSATSIAGSGAAQGISGSTGHRRHYRASRAGGRFGIEPIVTRESSITPGVPLSPSGPTSRQQLQQTRDSDPRHDLPFADQPLHICERMPRDQIRYVIINGFGHLDRMPGQEHMVLGTS
jgi:hypothetical protein